MEESTDRVRGTGREWEGNHHRTVSGVWNQPAHGLPMDQAIPEEETFCRSGGRITETEAESRTDRGGGGRSCRRLAQADRLEWEKDQPGTVGAGTDSDWTSDGGSNYPAVWTDPGAGSTAIGAQSFRARGTESTLADGYERPVPGGIGVLLSAVDTGRSQPVSSRFARPGTSGSYGRGNSSATDVSAVWSPRPDVDGSRSAMVGTQSRQGADAPVGRFDPARRPADLQWDSSSPDPRQGRTVSSHPEAHSRPSGGSRAIPRLGGPIGGYPARIQPHPSPRIVIDADTCGTLSAQSPSLDTEPQPSGNTLQAPRSGVSTRRALSGWDATTGCRRRWPPNVFNCDALIGDC